MLVYRNSLVFLLAKAALTALPECRRRSTFFQTGFLSFEANPARRGGKRAYWIDHAAPSHHNLPIAATPVV